jgi:hypothetical protein
MIIINHFGIGENCAKFVSEYGFQPYPSSEAFSQVINESNALYKYSPKTRLLMTERRVKV